MIIIFWAITFTTRRSTFSSRLPLCFTAIEKDNLTLKIFCIIHLTRSVHALLLRCSSLDAFQVINPFASTVSIREWKIPDLANKIIFFPVMQTPSLTHQTRLKKNHTSLFNRKQNLQTCFTRFLKSADSS